ncbi:MAG: YlxR family protein [Chloroflexi bacterium]|nr:YlxR family protein [Chloroflexota bacterium]
MAKKKRIQRKHIPQRTCVGCRITEPKINLIRIVRTSAGLQIEQEERLNGRGAYLHNRRSCWERGMQSKLANALKVNLTDEETDHLMAFMESFPEDEPLSNSINQ